MGQTKLERYAQEIVPGLWLGERWACRYAREAGFSTICVLESPCVQGCFHAPILAIERGVILNNCETQHPRKENGGFVRCEGHLLKTAHRVIDKFLKTGPALVHCLAGTERSPLVVATWLCERRGLALDSAYKLIMKKRPIIQKRDFWLSDAEESGIRG